MKKLEARAPKGSVEVAVGGHIDNDQKCPECGKPMFFYYAEYRSVLPDAAFCGNINGACPAVFKHVPVAEASR